MVGKKIIIGYGILVVIFLSFVIFTRRGGTFTGRVFAAPQGTNEYGDTACENIPLDYKKEVGTCLNRQSDLYGISRKPAQYSCTITNLDNLGGTFSVRIGFNAKGRHVESNQSRYVYPKSSEIFSFQADEAIDNCYCFESVPSRCQ